MRPVRCLVFRAMKQVRDQVRAARGNQSQESFARDGGVSVKTVSRWEAGTSLPSSRAHIDFLVSRGVERSTIEDARASRLTPVAS